MFDDLLNQSDLFNLVAAIRESLLDRSALFTRPTEGKLLQTPTLDVGVRGKLRIVDGADAEYDAQCTVIGSATWRRHPLKVFCNEPWMKCSLEWHQLRERTSWYLCYELPERWEDRVAKVAAANDNLTTIEFAKEFCLRAARTLIEKHLFAHRHNITKWPSEWDAWPHSRQSAVRQFREELRRAG